MRKVRLSPHPTTWTVPAPAPSPQGAAVLTEPGPCPCGTAAPHASPQAGIERTRSMSGCSAARLSQESSLPSGCWEVLLRTAPLLPCRPTPRPGASGRAGESPRARAAGAGPPGLALSRCTSPSSPGRGSGVWVGPTFRAAQYETRCMLPCLWGREPGVQAVNSCCLGWPSPPCGCGRQ